MSECSGSSKGAEVELKHPDKVVATWGVGSHTEDDLGPSTPGMAPHLSSGCLGECQLREFRHVKPFRLKSGVTSGGTHSQRRDGPAAERRSACSAPRSPFRGLRRHPRQIDPPIGPKCRSIIRGRCAFIINAFPHTLAWRRVRSSNERKRRLRASLPRPRSSP